MPLFVLPRGNAAKQWRWDFSRNEAEMRLVSYTIDTKKTPEKREVDDLDIFAPLWVAYNRDESLTLKSILRSLLHYVANQNISSEELIEILLKKTDVNQKLEEIISSSDVCEVESMEDKKYLSLVLELIAQQPCLQEGVMGEKLLTPKEIELSKIHQERMAIHQVHQEDEEKEDIKEETLPLNKDKENKEIEEEGAKRHYCSQCQKVIDEKEEAKTLEAEKEEKEIKDVSLIMKAREILGEEAEDGALCLDVFDVSMLEGEIIKQHTKSSEKDRYIEAIYHGNRAIAKVFSLEELAVMGKALEITEDTRFDVC